MGADIWDSGFPKQYQTAYICQSQNKYVICYVLHLKWLLKPCLYKTRLPALALWRGGRAIADVLETIRLHSCFSFSAFWLQWVDLLCCHRPNGIEANWPGQNKPPSSRGFCHSDGKLTAYLMMESSSQLNLIQQLSFMTLGLRQGFLFYIIKYHRMEHEFKIGMAWSLTIMRIFWAIEKKYRQDDLKSNFYLADDGRFHILT